MHVAELLNNMNKAGAKPQTSPDSKDIGKHDPNGLDELEKPEQTVYRSDTGRILYIASGRFDLQHSARTRLADRCRSRCAWAS
mgnify:CR=1 FL=1